MTLEIKAVLSRKIKLTYKGMMKVTKALVSKTGLIITPHNACKIRQLDASEDARALWNNVSEMTGKTDKNTTPKAGTPFQGGRGREALASLDFQKSSLHYTDLYKLYRSK
jgi:hypothetical protein